jgi:hypothetical protein
MRGGEAKSRQLLINALTGHVGTGTDLSGYPTYRELPRRSLHRVWSRTLSTAELLVIGICCGHD